MIPRRLPPFPGKRTGPLLPQRRTLDVERRPRLTVLAVVIAALVLLMSSRTAAAQNKAVESAAKALQKKAMEEDYLNVELDKATEHLNQAIHEAEICMSMK